MTIPRTVCLGFLAVITVGTLLLMMPFSASNGEWTNPLVALFMATSAVCVTGLAVVDPGSYFSFWGQFVLVALVQIGGLGYMTTTTFLLLLVGRRFELRHKVAIQQDLDRPGLEDSALVIRSIIATTMIFEITGIFLLLPVFVPDYGWRGGLWFAIFHSINSWNNAGFGLLSDNLIKYHSSILVNLVVPGLIIFGGIGYRVIFEMFLWIRDRVLRKPERIVFSLNFKVAISTTLVLLILGTIAFLLAELHNPNTLGSMSFGDKLLAAWFQSVSPRTAGFNTIDISKMTETGLFITIALMFVGASPGGTGGGLKTTTLRVLTSCTKSILQGKEDVELYQRQVPISLILKAVGVLVGSVATVGISTMIISLTDPDFEFIQLLFEVVSGFATVGLSTGITAKISATAQLVLIPTMYIGRVSVLLVIAAILGDPRPSAVHYPEENLLVG
jgi:trk system potassium uptake protein TrkH